MIHQHQVYFNALRQFCLFWQTNYDFVDMTNDSGWFVPLCGFALMSKKIEIQKSKPKLYPSYASAYGLYSWELFLKKTVEFRIFCTLTHFSSIYCSL